MINIVFAICSLIFNAILFIVFFSKPKLFSKENKIFSNIIICSLLGVLLEIFCFMLLQLNFNENNGLYILTNKLILIYNAWWITLFSEYIGEISNHSKLNSIYNKITIIMSFILLIVPLSFIKQNNMIIPSGLIVYLVYLVSIIY